MTSIDIPCPGGLAFFPYQLEGIQFALSRSGTLVGDEQGTGKTVQVCGLINALGAQLHRILIVCPATMRLVWRGELDRWLTSQRSIGVAGVDPVTEQILARVGILIVNYDRLDRMQNLIISRQWDLAVLDECHLAKNPLALRSKVISKIRALRRLALSGTPMPNGSPLELYPILSWIDPDRWPPNAQHDFGLRYCGARRTVFGWEYSGASNMGELGELLRSTVMLRRTKTEVLPQLPPKLRSVVELAFDSTLDGLVKAELEAFNRWSKDGVEDLYDERIGRLRPVQAGVDWDNLSKARHDLAIAKVPLIYAFIREIFQASPHTKLVVFCHHRRVIRDLRDALKSFSPVIL
jgi:SWI/SNF-related matrix-associated actin-dependent regulator 1 of chromatin subfamily A